LNGNQVYLPLIVNTGSFYLNQPIWASESQTQPHEVALFRLSFNVPQSLTDVELHLFADTRYQAWLDGDWVGRGPARFALTYRQYDVYHLESLAPGEHVLAVLAQWSPDNRRSESVRPLLQGAVQGSLPDGSPFILRTGPEWRALLTPAWRSDSALIHQWGLIGYSELLDLSQLPGDWFQAQFNDSDWPQAVVVDPTLPVASRYPVIEEAVAGEAYLGLSSPADVLAPIQYSPRSIGFPLSEPVAATLLDAGVLLPGRSLGEIPAGTPSPYVLPFQADRVTPFTLETLAAGEPPADTLILLDGVPLAWQVAGNLRPDVYLAQLELGAGPHILTFNPPTEGLTFALTTANLSGLNMPFQQGNHAGRRLLLAEPASQPEVVIASPGALNSLEFTQLPAYVVLDLGRVTHGRLTAQISGPAGTVIDVGWDERLLEGTTRPLPYPGSLHAPWNQTDSWILDGSSRQLTTIDARSGRYILIAVWGSGPVHLDDLTVYSEHYPLTQMGTFQSSDPLLDQIWQIGVDTTQLNMVEAYMDPWRERGQWWGDSFVVDQINQVAFGDAGLLRRGLLFMANAFPETGAPGCAPHNNGLHMLDYAMLWVHSLADYARRTGDLTLLENTYPTLQTFLLHLESFENPDTGLLDLPKTHWSETAYIDTLGYQNRYGQSTALNSIYYSTLLKAAAIAAQVGDLANHDLWQGRAATVQANLNTLLYLPEQGRYLTNIYEDVAYPPTLYAQAWPLAYGLVPESERGRVADALLELLSSDPAAPNVGTYGFYWILEGLGQAGYYDQAISLIKSYYGRLIDLGARTWWENFRANQYYTNALSHAWGGAPTWFLTSYILGARQTGPDEWRLQPALTNLEQAAGSLPMAQGAVQIAWQRSACTAGASASILHLELNAPEGTHGQLVLPASAGAQWVILNGESIWAASDATAPAEFITPLAAGSQVIEIGTACAGLP
jgi:alpha-L-rhamnosidase